MKKILLVILVVIVILLLIDLLPNRTTGDKTALGGVYELRKMELGCYKQSVLIRGFDRNNPIVVFLHGGPGYASISYIKAFQKEIEKNFVVVNWDQRGGGQSFSLSLDKKSMTEEQLLEDLDGLIDSLCSEFGKDKVYLVGHSWGTVLGKDYAQKHPEKLKYYIGIGQCVSADASDEYTYPILLAEAEKRNDQKALKKLKKAGNPPYSGLLGEAVTLRKYINKYDGNEINVNTSMEMLKSTIFEPEYSFIDLLRLFIGSYYSIAHLYPEYKGRDFRTESLEFDIPVLFIMGKNDLVTNHFLAKDYFNIIKAPQKDFILFDNSGHEPYIEDPHKFSEILKECQKSEY
ncbi:MAG: alpha/beta hydrolase [Spirochaetales bacterium]|nr:alpha/beta hydrolase [Spirochaetales bacterium]